MKRHYVLIVAEGLLKSDQPADRQFGKLLLEVIPEDERKIPLALIQDIKGEIERGIKMMSSEIEGSGATSWTDEKALGWIDGTPFSDERKEYGWSKHELAMFARGYAVGRSIQKMNDDEVLNMLHMIVSKLEREATPAD